MAQDAVSLNGAGVVGRRRGIAFLWDRKIDHYPNTGPRVAYLAIVVLATIVLYYQAYIAGGVATKIIPGLHMSFRYFVYTLAIMNLVGAFASLVAGLADRWGRANLVAYGLVVVGLLSLVGIPHATTKMAFVIVTAAIGFVEGVILVATPALVRDFSPQLGRASAMGFWTLGPVIGSLVVTEVTSNTVNHLAAWQDQFMIAGATGLVLALIALVGLRELSPKLRDQLMVSMRDRMLIEARAQGMSATDIEASLKHPWRQMLHLDILGGAFAVSTLLLFYYAAVGFFVIYFNSIYGFSTAKANSLGNWFWAFDALALVVTGIISDIVKVRKPFMLIGALGMIAMTILFLSKATHPSTSAQFFAVNISILAAFNGVAYSTWMAAFTETVEKRNPALTATGLAVWGWIIRIVVAVSTFIIPTVVASTNPLVAYGSQVQAYATQYPAIKYGGAIDPATAAALKDKSSPTYLQEVFKARDEIAAQFKVDDTTALNDLIALGKVPTNVQDYMAAHANEVIKAKNETPHQWQHWWWVCVGGQVLFIPFIFVLTGRWRPKKAREDAAAHEALVQSELAKLQGGGGAAPATATV